MERSADVQRREKELPQYGLDIADSNVLASCTYGPRVYGNATSDIDVRILLVTTVKYPRLSSFTTHLDQAKASVLKMSRETFESDAKHGSYGEIVADVIALPYCPEKNPEYLKEAEITVKRRLVLETLGNVFSEYPELSTELLIDPEYFMYEFIRKRVGLLPSSMERFAYAFCKDVRTRNVRSIMRGYREALSSLETEGLVKPANGYVQLTGKFLSASKQKQNRFSNVLLSIRRGLLPYVRGFSSRIAAVSTHWRKTPQNTDYERAQAELTRELEETEKYLLMPTPTSPAPISNKTNIQDFARKNLLAQEESKMAITNMGGALNRVFLISIYKDREETQRIVAKKFEDWQGFKWFPLALWTLGTQSFAVLGKTRLEREYTLNQFLNKNSFKVPRVLYVSLKERLIFQEYVEGRKLDEIVKAMIASPSAENMTRERRLLRRVGEEIARAHSLRVTLGDCKPENILVADEEDVYFLDLEQATRNGNQPWDIAEFLYYSGHYVLPIHSDRGIRTIALSFLEGYVSGGGRKETVRKAASAKYVKVFSLFALPHILLLIGNICKEIGERKTLEVG